MPQNQIIPWATGVGANTLAAGLLSSNGTVAQGFEAGTASSIIANTILRQVSVIASALAQFTADNQSADVLDDGSVSNFESKFSAALKGALAASSVHFGIATGTGDAMVVTAVPPMLPATGGGYQPGSFLVLKTPSTANTSTAPTVNVNSIGNIAITKSSAAALAAGDNPATTWTILFFDGTGCYRFGLQTSDIHVTITGTEGVKFVNGVCSLDFVDLTEEDTLNANDLIAFYASEAEGGQALGHHYKTTITNLAAKISALIGGGGGGGGTAVTGTEGVQVNSWVASLNFNGLTEEDTLNANDLVAFYAVEAEGGQAANRHFKTTIANLANTLGVLSGFTHREDHSYTTPGSYNLSVPSWAKRIGYRVWAGGGAGGNGQNGGSGGGGGGGQYDSDVVLISTTSIVPGTTALTILCGAGGAVSTSNGANGGNGGVSSISGIGVAMIGGQGGLGTTTPYAYQAGGAGGSGGSGSPFAVPGATGGTGGAYQTATGGGAFGTPNQPENVVQSGYQTAGVVGAAPGGGGSASGASPGYYPLGGAGGSGRVDIWFEG